MIIPEEFETMTAPVDIPADGPPAEIVEPFVPYPAECQWKPDQYWFNTELEPTRMFLINGYRFPEPLGERTMEPVPILDLLDDEESDIPDKLEVCLSINFLLINE